MKSLQNKFLHALSLASLVALLASTVYAAITITTVDSTGNVGNESSLTLNSSGFPVISYYDATNGSLKLAVCGNVTCSINTITTVDSAGDVGLNSSLLLNSSGFPVISYRDITNDDLKVAVCGNAPCSINTITTVDNVGDVGWHTSLALNSSDFPVVSYYDIGNADLKVAVCGNVTCSISTLTTVDNFGSVGQDTSLALNSSGFPVISYYDSSNGDLKVAVCGNATCSAGNTLTTVDNSAGNVGEESSLVLNSSGFPVISHYDQGNDDLKLAVCGNATCSAGNTLTTVDSAGFVGLYTSLELNSSGFPVISYQERINDNLKVAVCGNVTCSINTITTVDTVGSVGWYTSLDLNSSDFPVISYYDLTNGDLKVAFLDNTAPTILDPTLTAASLPQTGFAPNKITSLPAQPADLAYSKLGSLWLEIPSQKVKINIVGVPQSENAWDVKWLGQDAGWLNGTAYPTWEGNSVITAHVTDSNGMAGPFANIKNLKYGDQIIVHMFEQQYIFEVRNTRMARPASTSFAFQHLESHSFLTLITCQGYNPLSDSYLFRRVVRAVLLDIK